MLNALQGVMLYSNTYTWSEALCSLQYMDRSFMLIVIHELKLYDHCYTWCKAVCSLLYME